MSAIIAGRSRHSRPGSEGGVPKDGARHTTLREALHALDEHLFVGRTGEVNTFRAWLLADDPRPSILSVSGRGGIGKSALLGAFRRVSEGVGRRVIVLDGHTMEPTPECLLDRLAETLQSPTSALDAIVDALNREPSVLMIDTFEQLGQLSRYLQDVFLPRVATDVRLVVAGRHPLGQMWSASPTWRSLIRPLPLDGLRRSDAKAYLTRRGVADRQLVAQITEASAGYPLALSLAADLALQHGIRDFPSAPAWRLAVRELVERLLREADDRDLRMLLEASAIVRQFDEAALAALVDLPDIGPAFAKLCSLSVVQPSERGLMLHSDVRQLIADDLRWRRPEAYDTLHRRALRYYRRRMSTAGDDERHWLLGERLYLWEDGLIRALLFEDQEPGRVWIEPIRDEDVDEVLEAWPRFLRATLTTSGVSLDQLTEGADPTFLRRVAGFFEQSLRHPAAWRRAARDSRGKLVGSAVHLPVCGETFPLFRQHPAYAPLLEYYFTPDELTSLPRHPQDAQIWWIVSIGYGEDDVSATRAAISRDTLGLFARGGLYLALTPLDVFKQLLQALGFERIPEVRSSVWGRGSPTDGFVLDLRRIGVEAWIEAIMAGRRPPRSMRLVEIERALSTLLPHWEDDALLRESPLATSTVIDPNLSRDQRPSAIRHSVGRALANARAAATADSELALRAVELAYLTPHATISRDGLAARLNVSRRTVYRLLERGIHALAVALSASHLAGPGLM